MGEYARGGAPGPAAPHQPHRPPPTAPAFSWVTDVAPMMVDATFQRPAHHASASCVGVRPCFCATLTYSPTA